MHQKWSHQSKVKHSKKMRKVTASIAGVSRLSRQAKRRFYCKVKFFMWRKQQQKFRFGTFHFNKKNICSPCLSLRIRLQKNKTRTRMKHAVNNRNIQVQASASVLRVGCDTEGADGALATRLPALNEPESGAVNGSCRSQDCVSDPNTAPTFVTQTTQTTADFSQSGDAEITETLTRCRSVGAAKNPGRSACGVLMAISNPGLAQQIDVDRQSEQQTAATQSLTAEQEPEGAGEKTAASQTDDVSLKTLVKDIHEFLNDFYKRYGSFIPLQRSDVLQHLRSRFNTEFDDRQTQIFSEVLRWRATMVLKPAPSFRVVYKKHELTLEDLLTLADQNWLNDQVMNMYGELIMDSSHHKVHFLNSFFHRQLMTKGYDGVKRWTKKVDLFSKSLLLVPIHLEVHWCLVTADIDKKKICLYDSQGNALHKVARNILKYLMTEAKEKKQAAFEYGWAVSFDEKVPQQTTENDCGVFVLEYSRCLGLTKPLQFSQSDIPKIRKRIYRELCERKLFE